MFVDSRTMFIASFCSVQSTCFGVAVCSFGVGHLMLHRSHSAPSGGPPAPSGVEPSNANISCDHVCNGTCGNVITRCGGALFKPSIHGPSVVKDPGMTCNKRESPLRVEARRPRLIAVRGCGTVGKTEPRHL